MTSKRLLCGSGRERGGCSEQVPMLVFTSIQTSSAFLRFSPQLSALCSTLPLHLPSNFFNHLPLAGASKLPPPPLLATQLTTTASGPLGPPQPSLLRQPSTLSSTPSPLIFQPWHRPQLSAKLIWQTSPCCKRPWGLVGLTCLVDTLGDFWKHSFPAWASLPQAPSLQRLWSSTSGSCFCFLCPVP